MGLTVETNSWADLETLIILNLLAVFFIISLVIRGVNLWH